MAKADQFGLWPQSAATLGRFIVHADQELLPSSNSNPQFKTTDMIVSAIVPEPDEELGNNRR